jgi:hypothetical protein
MRCAGDGFFWPQLLVLPEGRRTLLSWSADDVPLSGILRFVGAGRAWGRPEEVQAALAGFVTAVIDRLGEMRVSGTLLQEEWAAVLAADAEETSFCDVAAAFGLDPYDIDETTATALESLGTVIGEELVGEFAVAADPRRINEDAHWVALGLRRLSHEPGKAHAQLAKLRGVELAEDDARPPWEIGWYQAQEVRRIFRIGDTEPIRLDGLVTHRELVSADTALQALASGVSGRIEVVLGARVGVAGQRFVHSRALWRALHVPDRPYLLTTAATFEQRVERAFAAELLAPASGIAQMMETRGGVVLADDVERIARRYKASPVVVSHQLENQLGLAVAG